MSFILEALRRAENERQRGSVPGLHTLPEAGLPASDAARPSAAAASGPLVWLLACASALAVLGAIALLAWWLGRGGLLGAAPATSVAGAELPPLAAAGRGAASAPPAPVPTPVTASAALPTPAAAPATPPPVPAAPAPAPTEVWLSRAGPSTPPSTGSAAGPSAAPRARPAGAAVPGAASAPSGEATAGGGLEGVRPAATAPAAGGAPPWLADLPALKAQLPALAVGGGLYSEQAEQRLVIVNGQVAREGELVAPGLRLEQIRPRSVVFSYQGQRFAVPM